MQSSLEQYIAANFQAAIEGQHIQVYYQPVIRTISRQLCSFEALARWADPMHGLIQPDQFIPVLEKQRVIHRLDCCVIRQVCARLRRTLESGGVPIPVSVNVSRLDFSLCDMFSAVDEIVTRYQIPHDFIYIEITESVMADGEDAMRSIVDRFREAGYQVWMDDFGSAYSSLNALKDFAFDEIKLDMRFLSSFNQRARRILCAVIQMAKEIDIHTLAEGVETEEQFMFLRNIGCEKVQGFYFGPPLPYEASLEHLQTAGIPVEKPQDRKYYDDIGKVNLLSAVPFMTRAERDSLTTARQLNSIPLAIVEARADGFSILFYNTAFEETVMGTGFVSGAFSQEMLGVTQSYSQLPARLVNLMDSTRAAGEGRMLFISNEEYYDVRTKRIALAKDACSLLFRLSNLSKASEAAKTNHLDVGLRQLYTLFERITLINATEDTISPLYVATREDLLSGRTDIRRLALEYSERWIFPDDREDYLALVDISTLEARMRRAGRTHVSEYFRTYVRHGQYAWKHYTLLRLSEGVYAELIRNVHSEFISFGGRQHRPADDAAREGDFSAELLWNTLVRSNIIRMFWKDVDRRFLGASNGFLEYYGFGSVAEILGKNDEDLGWHIRPDHYMADELRVIHEGVSVHNIPGRCISNGENRDILASKTPLYDENGEIRGLVGYFIDKDLLTVNDVRGKETKRRDALTGLLNSRGVSEEAHAFQDEFYLRNVDFVRMHVAIDDFAAINRQYGFDFGDKAIATFGHALKRAFGLTSAVGRYTGHEFVILHQIRDAGEPKALRARIKQIAAGIREIDGVALTFYLSVGYALYSEAETLTEQMKLADIRLLADHDDHTTPENRIARASELFRLFDDLPIPYAVYHVRADENGGATDAILFYVNPQFEAFTGRPASALLGHGTRRLFPDLGDDWYDVACRAALRGETVENGAIRGPGGRSCRVTASQVIHPGYCALTYRET